MINKQSIINNDEERRPPIMDETSDKMIVPIINTCHLFLNLLKARPKAAIATIRFAATEKRLIIKASKRPNFKTIVLE